MPDIRKQDLVAQAAVLGPIKTSRRSMWAVMQSGAANPANAEFQLEASWNGVDYFICDVIDPADPLGATVAKITGANKAAYARIPAAEYVRVTRVDANGGNGDCSLTVTED